MIFFFRKKGKKSINFRSRKVYPSLKTPDSKQSLGPTKFIQTLETISNLACDRVSLPKKIIKNVLLALFVLLLLLFSLLLRQTPCHIVLVLFFPFINDIQVCSLSLSLLWEIGLHPTIKSPRKIKCSKLINMTLVLKKRVSLRIICLFSTDGVMAGPHS